MTLRELVRQRIDQFLTEPQSKGRVLPLFTEHYKRPPKHTVLRSLTELDTMTDAELLILFEIMVYKVYQQR